MNLKSFNKIKKIIILIVNFIKKKTTFIFIVLTLIIILLAGLIFYQYGYRASYFSREVPAKELKINYQLYQKIISYFKEREKRIEEGIGKQYSDPFR